MNRLNDLDMTPLVSVCIPTFNGEATIGATIQSVLSQRYENFEIVISDDGSIDQTLAIVKMFKDPRIRVLENIPATSAAANWNRTWMNSEGQFVKIMGQDDILYADCLVEEVSGFDLNQDANISFVFSRRDVISRSNRLLIKGRGRQFNPAVVHLQDFLPGIIRSGSNPLGEPVALLINRRFLNEAGLFEGNYTVDLDMWLRLLALAPAFATNKTLVAFRVGGGSWSHNLRSTQANDTTDLHKRVSLLFPLWVSRSDLVIGFFMARIMQFIRIPGIILKEYDLILRENALIQLQKMRRLLQMK